MDFNLLIIHLLSTFQCMSYVGRRKMNKHLEDLRHSIICSS